VLPPDREADELAELRELARTAGVETVAEVVQHRSRPDPRSYVGKGKLNELKQAFGNASADVLIVDDELGPSQQRLLEDALQARVVDRTQLILDIFAQHAVSAEGKLQVELAQLEYNLPRMRGMWQHLERLGGGVGTRGPGETQLETDRRLARRRVAILKRRLAELSRQRDTRRKSRRRSQTPTVALAGYTNVGKSTLLNALTGTARAIVSPIAGTTRDAVDELMEKNGKLYRFIDTAGIRRKGKTSLMAEKLSVVMARKHLEAADVALLVLDAVEGVSALDATIGGYAHESGRSVIIVVNKWDLVGSARRDGQRPADRALYEQQIRRALKFLDYAPVVFVSATEGKNLDRVFKTLELVESERRKRIPTSQMNRFLETVDFERAGVPHRQKVHVFYMTQASVSPPTFVLFTDKDVKLHFSYERFLENQIRKAFGFTGTPIRIKNRARSKVELARRKRQR